jgi:hypothetical protein
MAATAMTDCMAQIPQTVTGARHLIPVPGAVRTVLSHRSCEVHPDGVHVASWQTPTPLESQGSDLFLAHGVPTAG